MKIACICNLNNNLFSVARYLRDLGYEAHLLLFDNEERHFHPSVDALDRDFESYTHVLNWGSFWSFSNISPKTIFDDLKGFDFLIGCGAAPAFVSTAGRHLDFFLSSGGDIFEDTIYKYHRYRGVRSLSLKNITLQYKYYRYTRAQRNGISRAIRIASRNKLSRKLARQFGYKNDFASFDLPLAYDGIYNSENLENLRRVVSRYPVVQRAVGLMTDVRDKHHPIIFSHSRQLWKSRPHNFSDKGTDVLVRGFADFVNSVKGQKPCLVMLEYGPDMDESKKLVSELGIEKSVYWLPLLQRKEIMACISLCDIVASQFKYGFIVSGVLFEALCMGKPILGYRSDNKDDGDIVNDYTQLYPMMNVKTADDISQVLLDFVGRPQYYNEIGQEGRKWYINNVVEEFKESISRCIDEAI